MAGNHNSGQKSKLAEWAPTILSAVVFLVGGVIFYLAYEAPYKVLTLGSSTVTLFETIQPGIEVEMHNEWPINAPNRNIDSVATNRANYAVMVKNVGKLRCRIELINALFAKCISDGTYVFDGEHVLTTKLLGKEPAFDLLPGQKTKKIYTVEFEDRVPQNYCFKLIYKGYIQKFVKEYIQQLTESLGHRLNDEFFVSTYTLSIAVRPVGEK